jgi:large subunit ribosomal protein L13
LTEQKLKNLDTLSYKTVSANKNTVSKKWLIVDAENQVLGRLASRVAFVLRGKHKPDYTPHVDCGDNVVVINAEKVILSGDKMNQKEYIRHTGYPGGQRITAVKDMLENHPERIVEKAVKGMLPKNKLGADLFRNLKVYAGTEHNQEAQKPETFDINTIK